MSEEQLKALQNENEDLQDRLDRTLKELGVFSRALLEANVRIKELKAKLSEHEKGLPIEKANKKEEYYFKDNNHLTRIKWNEKRSSWCNSLCVQMDYENEWIKTVYPLPSVTKEGS